MLYIIISFYLCVCVCVCMEYEYEELKLKKKVNILCLLPSHATTKKKNENLWLEKTNLDNLF